VRNWREAIVAYFIKIFLNSIGDIEENHEKAVKRQ
jgi:hypothetical protein